ncbi:DUF6113 family protein [Cellulomonas sp. PhB143]|uniref:DUF6113 family protein n=1 Tax=Cellulomonas sp. PhB143 TaxID=2485186 RepID=UPI0018F4D86B|nr:DUF6113 family protein [Cellulomonas sp. PhB143]
MTTSIPAPPTQTPRRTSVARTVLRVVLCLLLGVLVGVIGTVTHRTQVLGHLPLGLVLAGALTLAAAVVARAWARGAGVLALGVGWLLAVQLMALEGPGGDVLIVADPTGYVWSYGGVVLVLVAALLPRRWFSDAAAGPRPGQPQPADDQPPPTA